MLDAGTKAPEFTLENDQGEDITLSSLLEGGPLILYFYPADFTPGCTKEACSIRDLHNDLLASGLRVVGVSPQSTASHARFREEYELPFTLLSDPDKVAVKAYDVDGPLGFGVRRATFLIGEDGEIRDAVMADIMIDRHTDFINRAIGLQDPTA